ncbi:MAG: D-glycero-beta-D-manno-heptose 1-phosphate adenylyltransferase [Nanoarchaeota archaeon]|nr:D-glycero-beta-D-manno-heptose 1-phosphate adenylyltransferase [Nanoarchaeota archaeon]
MVKAIFLDRDGTLVHDEGFVHRVEDFRLIDNVVEGLKLLKNKYLYFIVTNQAGVGTGKFTLSDLNKFNEHLSNALKNSGIEIKKIYYCPHTIEDNCACRKPKTKFLFEAENEFGIDLKDSFVIGDKNTDCDMGKRAGCRTVLVLSGHGKEHHKNTECDYAAKDLLDAAMWIIKQQKNLPVAIFFDNNNNNKIKTIEEIKRISEELKNQNKKIVTTNGVFDILHVGHIRYLQKAKSMGDVLIVAVNSDESVKKIKGPKRPLNNQNDRAEVLAALRCINYITIFNEESPINTLEKIRPDIHVKGGDYGIGQIVEKKTVEKNGGKVVLVGIEKGYSTTSLIDKIKLVNFIYII